MSEQKQRRIRILLAKPGLDGHDRGLLILAELSGTPVSRSSTEESSGALRRWWR